MIEQLRRNIASSNDRSVHLRRVAIIGRSATFKYEREQFDRRRSQCDPHQTVGIPPKQTVNGLGYLATVVGGLNCAISAQRPSLNHLLGTYEQRRRDRESERRCNLAVDQEFELGRLLHG